MRYEFLLDLPGREFSSFSYYSLIEEAIKLLSFVRKSEKPLIVVKENNYMAQRLGEIMTPYFDDDDLAVYLPEESMRSEEISTSYENRAARISALYQILKKPVKLIITSPYGFIRHLPEPQEWEDACFSFKVDDILNREELIDRLRKLGYEKVSHVETPMSFAERGYIVDVFSVNYDKPVRIEFFDDVIDSLRFFDINTQMTIEAVKEITLIPARDVFFDEEKKKFLKDKVKPESSEMELKMEYLFNDIFEQSQYFYTAYFPSSYLKDYLKERIIYLSDQIKIDDHLKILHDETFAYIREMHEEQKLPLKFSVFGDLKRICAKERILKGSPYEGESPLLSALDLPYGSIPYLMSLIVKDPVKTSLIVLDEKRMREVKDYLKKEKIPHHQIKNKLKEGICLYQGDLYGGYEDKKNDLKVYTAAELFRMAPRRGRFASRYAEATVLNSYEELNAGDYVVHDRYGIGQYVDISTRKINGISMDYLRILYKGNDELLVPLSQFSQVRKYVSKEGVVPKLHKLGSKEWTETKKRVEENVSDLAERLIDLYASRDEEIGFAYSKDNYMQKEFEDGFEFELTPDQVKAIKEVKEDMESSKPMDRLLCGDVGFGKTEVALRASFKAINDNKQVAYLCPTTVLSYQHYNTYRKRFENFPGRVELLNRFVPLNKQKEIIRDLKEGKVDILIGTHRILSSDVQFKDLGLLIIDEEQRFGVEHKEKIKEMKKSIDVLSLSATPIPRTLQLSLIGIRSLSTLDTPPENRYPIQTYVVHKSENMIQEIILRELERGGQVFYLMNNVQTIYSLANKLKKNIPYAKVDVVHGQMNSEDIEDVMLKFYHNEINVLVCTTIVETGLDIPNANTIIIEDAQNFGLSQLYQIKGRVGRSQRVAYAYLIVPEKKQLKEVSLKRLQAIKEFASLGSGYKIAMRDLTIRGAGDLLGPKQSGFIDNVGLDLYLMMLRDAIKRKRGEEVVREEKEIIHVPLESYIPDSFSSNDYEKLSIYHQLYEIDNKEDLLKYYLKIADEYGRLPEQVNTLFEKKKLELLYSLNWIEKITNRNNVFTIVLSKEFSDQIDGVKLFELCNSISRDISISYKNGKLELYVEAQKDGISRLLRLVNDLDKVRK